MNGTPPPGEISGEQRSERLGTTRGASLTEPPYTVSDPQELLAGQLDFHRVSLLRKLEGLTEAELRSSRLPSGWTPLELVWHLLHVERRWLRWGFEAELVADPWGDGGPGETDGWHVPEGMTTEEVLNRFLEQCDLSRTIAARVPLETLARTGGRFASEEEAPALSWILIHLLQEYARHVGHLDIVRELADGSVGE